MPGGYRLNLFELPDVIFTDFVIGDTFTVDTGSLAQINTLNIGNIPRISASSSDNGLLGYFALDERLVYGENIVTMTFLGDAFYHKDKVSLDMKVHSLSHENMSSLSGTYISSVLQKLKPYYSYGNQLSSSKLKLLKLTLPTTDGNNPDFDYMNKVIANIKVNQLLKALDINGRGFKTSFYLI